MKNLVLIAIVFLNFELAHALMKSNFYMKPKVGQYYAVTEKSDLDLPNMKICLTANDIKNSNIENAKKTCVENKLIDTPKHFKSVVVCNKNQTLIFEEKYISENKYEVIHTFEGKAETTVFTYSGAKCDADAILQYL